MSVVERLRTLDPPPPDVDVDAALAHVRGRARRRRQGRAVMAAVVVTVLGGAGFAAAALDGDDAQLDTAGPRGPVVRYLPAEVPGGFTLAWVDAESPWVSRSEDPVPWTAEADYDYAFGYRSDTMQLEALVFAGVGFDPDHVISSWGDGSEVSIDEDGNTVVVDTAGDPARAIVERKHGSILVMARALSGGERAVTENELLSFARSMRELSDEEWDAAIAGADTASWLDSPASETTLMTGETWTLLGTQRRDFRSVTEPALALRRTGPMGELGSFSAAVVDVVQVQLSTGQEEIVAWGVAPPGTERVRLTFDERTVEVQAVAYGPWMAFAVDVGEVAGEPRMTEALDGAGEVISAVVDHTQGSCVEAGNPTIDVPDVVGIPLWEAVRAIESIGFTVLGTGTPPEDPIDPGATISAQEPPAGTRLPKGACVGFRTTSG